MPYSTHISVHPKVRGISTILAIIGTLFANDIIIMLFAWLVLLIPLFTLTSTMRSHGRFVIKIVAPIFIILLVVWGWLVGAPPGLQPGSSSVDGARFAIFISLRLILLGGIFQLCFLSIPYDKLINTFRQWGLKGNWLVVAAGAFTIWPELKLRGEQILDARYARGLTPDRKLFSRIQQFPFLLRPLLTWAIRSANDRTQLWDQRRLILKLGRRSSQKYHSSFFINAYVLLISITWLIINLLFI